MQATLQSKKHRGAAAIRVQDSVATRCDASLRLCVVCREARPASRLVQLKIARALAAGASGRSAYVCINTACLERLHKKTLSRAWRLDGDKVGLPKPADVRTQVHTLATSRALSALGLARRCGELVIGIDLIMEKQQMGMLAPDAVCVIATDLAPRSARKLPHAVAFLDSRALGQALGMGSLGAATVRPGRLAKQAAYWLRVWYETASFAADASKDTNSEPREVA